MTLPRGVREAGLALLAAGAVLLLFAAFADRPALRAFETASLDLRFRLRGPLHPGPEVTVVLVDDKSLGALGRWPFSRHLFARALRLLDDKGAKLVVFDLLFAEPDLPLPADLRAAARTAAARLSSDQDPALRSALARLADDDPDSDFAAAIAASHRVLLPIAFAFTGPRGEEPDTLADAGYQQFDKSPKEPFFPLRPTSSVLPIDRLAHAAAGLGHSSIAYDADGEPRYDYLALPYGADFLPSLPVRAAAAALDVAWPQVALALGEGVRIGRDWVPTDRAMRLLVNYRGPRGTFPTFSFVDLLQGHVPDASLRGHIVVIGASFIGSSDAFASPYGSTPLPGAERMANIIDTILRRDFVAEPPRQSLPLVGVAVLLLAALTAAATTRLPTRAAALAGVMPPLLWFGAAQAAFLRGLWLPLTGPVVALAAAMASVVLFRYWVVDREGRQVQAAFRHYLSPQMVDVLAAHPERLKLGGETRPLTLLFCDLRDFTAISEAHKSNPQELTRLINRFLTPMTDIIQAHRGTIDKYIGDCIMAFWNAPLDDPGHAEDACAAALAMLDELPRLNAALAAEATGAPPPRLAIGIGINSGDCVVGNMGSDRRFDYSVLGDAVNLAARLESQTKTYRVPVILGEATRLAAPGPAALEIDRIAVKGKKEAVRIYTLLGDAAAARSPGFSALAACHERMLAAYRARDWSAARMALGECRGGDPRLAALYALYEERIAEYEADPPGADWDGVYVAKTK
jgi:adenylate cyclase